MSDAEKILQSLGTIVLTKCPSCGKLAPTSMILSVRGKVGCMRCHLDWVWDYIEENRRGLNGIVEQVNSVDWKKTEKQE